MEIRNLSIKALSIMPVKLSVRNLVLCNIQVFLINFSYRLVNPCKILKRGLKADIAADIRCSYLQPDLTEIVAVWKELPGRIMASIKALIQTHTKGS
jgi:hypothetical protein